MQGLVQTMIPIFILESGFDVIGVVEQQVQDLWIDFLITGIIHHALAQDITHFFMAPGAPRKAKDKKRRWQAAIFGILIERRHQLPPGQIARHPEDDNCNTI